MSVLYICCKLHLPCGLGFLQLVRTLNPLYATVRELIFVFVLPTGGLQNNLKHTRMTEQTLEKKIKERKSVL